jgi:hypothetical protein
MSDLKLPQDKDKKPEVSFSRMAIWIVVGAIGLYMVVNGLLTAANS